MFDLLRYKKIPPALLLACFLFFFAVCGEAAVDIVNELTEGHTRMPGTNIYFITPGDMKPSDRFNGFASDGRVIEVIVASIKSPYSEISGVFTDANLLTRGVKVRSRGDITVNGSTGILLKALHEDGDKKWGKWIMILEDGNDSLVVNGIFASGDEDAARDVEAMLKSVVLESDEAQGSEAEVTSVDAGEFALDISLRNIEAGASRDVLPDKEEGVHVDDEDEDVD
jgi:hypothetical protein